MTTIDCNDEKMAVLLESLAEYIRDHSKGNPAKDAIDQHEEWIACIGAAIGHVLKHAEITYDDQIAVLSAVIGALEEIQTGNVVLKEGL